VRPKTQRKISKINNRQSPRRLNQIRLKRYYFVQSSGNSNANKEVDEQKVALKELADKSKRLVRAKQIDDSIELKEKLNSLQIQLSNLDKMGVTRLSEIEQAIAKNFFESYNSVSNWFDEIEKELEREKRVEKTPRRHRLGRCRVKRND
jgi:hypothetical protein